MKVTNLFQQACVDPVLVSYALLDDSWDIVGEDSAHLVSRHAPVLLQVRDDHCQAKVLQRSVP